MDVAKVNTVIERWKTLSKKHYGVDFAEYALDPLVEAFGEDVEEILAYLNTMEVDDLEEISGCFEEIYGKFMTDEVYDALEELEEKISASHQ